MEKIKLNIEAINESLDEAKVKKRESLKVEPGDIEKMINSLKILDVLEEGITLLGGEKFSTASVVLPFEKRMMELLEESDEDPLYMDQFK